MAHTCRGSILFVASLLPARFIVQHAATLRVREIVVLNAIHEQSYAYVARRLDGATVTRLPGGMVWSSVGIVVRLLLAKIRGQSVTFFHECCWPVLDLAVAVIRPSGSFFPQVTMSGFDVIEPGEVPPPARWSRRFQFLLLRTVLDRFIVYRAQKQSGAAGADYFFAFRRYPPSIAVFPIADRSNSAERGRETDARDVLFISGTEAVEDDYLRRVYLEMIQAAQREGYGVFIKDHPIYRLNVPVDAGVVIDPAMPIELIEQRFTFAVGVASTALLGVGRRKISIVNALDEMSDDVKRRRISHLKSLAGGDRVEFVSTAAEFQRILHEHPA